MVEDIYYYPFVILLVLVTSKYFTVDLNIFYLSSFYWFSSNATILPRGRWKQKSSLGKRQKIRSGKATYIPRVYTGQIPRLKVPLYEILHLSLNKEDNSFLMTARRKKWSGVGKLSETSSGCLTIWRGSFRFRFRFRRLATESKNGLVRVL